MFNRNRKPPAPRGGRVRVLPYVKFGGYDAVTGERVEPGPHDPPAYGVVHADGSWQLFASLDTLKIARTGVAMR